MEVGQSYNPADLWGTSVPRWLKRRPNFCPGAKLAFELLTEYVGQVAPRVDEMAMMLGVKERQMSGYLTLLKAAGLLTAEAQGPGRGCRYDFLWHPWAEEREVLPTQDTADVASGLPTQHVADVAAPEPEATQDTADVEVLPTQDTADVSSVPFPLVPPEPPLVPPTPAADLTRDSVPSERSTSPSPAGKPDPKFKTKQALNIAVAHCVDFYQAKFRDLHPGLAPPLIQATHRAKVRYVVEAIATADGLDFLQAEAVCKRMIVQFLQDDSSWVHEQGFDLTCLQTRMNALRNGQSNGPQRQQRNGRHHPRNPIPTLTDAEREQRQREHLDQWERRGVE